MKYLLLLGILLVAYLLWRNGRRPQGGGSAQPKAAAKAQPQDMVQCAVCAVHLPRSEAVAAADGRLFCSQEHRLGAGG